MNRQKVLHEGILVGLAGAAAVAIWFLVLDLITASPFRTPALLGAVLFDGLRDPAALTITPALVLRSQSSTPTTTRVRTSPIRLISCPLSVGGPR
jgi:hypothetical protein